MITHVVMFRLAEGTPFDDVAAVLEGLARTGPGVRRWTLGRHVGTESFGRAWDGVFVCAFDSLVCVEEFMHSPEHLAELGNLRSLLTDIAIVDSTDGAG